MRVSWKRTQGRKRAVVAAMVFSALLVVGAGCSDDDSSQSAGASPSAAGDSTSTGSSTAPSKGGGSTTTPATTTPRPIPLSKPAQRKGGEDCAGMTPTAVVKRYLPAVKRSKATDTAAVRRSLVTQLKQLRKAQGQNAVPAPVAAAIYAVSKPRTQRSGAYQGCLRALVKQANP